MHSFDELTKFSKYMYILLRILCWISTCTAYLHSNEANVRGGVILMISSLPKKLAIFESVIVVHFMLVMCNDFFFCESSFHWKVKKVELLNRTTWVLFKIQCFRFSFLLFDSLTGGGLFYFLRICMLGHFVMLWIVRGTESGFLVPGWWLCCLVEFCVKGR